jgi:GNAT superfamily N-acetyltransferase
MTATKHRGSSRLIRLPYRLETMVHRLVPHWLFHPRCCWLYSMPVQAAPTLAEPAASNAASVPRFRWATADDRVALEQQAGPEVVKRRLEAGHRAATLWLDKKLIGTAWFARDRYDDDETTTTIALSPNQCWLFASWVDRDHRSQGHYKRIITSAYSELQSNGVSEVLFAVDASNFMSQAAHRSLGAKLAGSLIGLRILGLPFYRVRHRSLQN